MSARNPSPLRYPGGKISLFEVLLQTIYRNGLQGSTYVEPFAGGAGAGLKLLIDGHMDRVVINDRDRAVFCFWKSVMQRSEDFVDRIQNVPLVISEWERQRDIYRGTRKCSELDLGFAAFFLNRCNRSGIIVKAGPIGGMAQTGKWKLDARFNRQELSSRVRNIASYEDRIRVTNNDARDVIIGLQASYASEKCFVYADPPYYKQGKALYYSHYKDDDHASFASLMLSLPSLPWVMTYDDVPRIRQLYKTIKVEPFRLRYSAHAESLEGGEVFIIPRHVTAPPGFSELLLAKRRNAKSRQIDDAEHE